MKAHRMIATIALLAAVPAGQAQELRRTPDGIVLPEMGDGLQKVYPLRNNVEWLREEIDPILRERRHLRIMRQQTHEQAQTTAAGTKRNRKARNPGVRIRNWRFEIGNDEGYRSPLPDSELDARNLRFPLRRDMQAKPDPQPATEINRTKLRLGIK